jgi:GT2 family glycosyltransferase
MLESIPNGTPIIIVDNGSQDITELKKVSKKFGAKLIINKINKGFGEASNQGANIAKTEFIFFLNPDATIETETLINLEKSAAINPNVFAMNPKILKPSGRQYFKRSSHLLDRSDWMSRVAPEETCLVNILSGAAFFIRRKVFNDIGGWDENIFLYHEEDDLCIRIQQNNGKLMFVSTAIARHIRGSSTPQSKESSYFKGWHMGQSRVYATRKHKRRFAISYALIESILQLISPVSLISSRKRAKSWGYLSGVISSLRQQKN